MQLENANSSVATVTGLQVGTYVFTLTVKDERNLQSRSSVNVIVKEGVSCCALCSSLSGSDSPGIHFILFGAGLIKSEIGKQTGESSCTFLNNLLE